MCQQENVENDGSFTHFSGCISNETNLVIFSQRATLLCVLYFYVHTFKRAPHSFHSLIPYIYYIANDGSGGTRHSFGRIYL